MKKLIVLLSLVSLSAFAQTNVVPVNSIITVTNGVISTSPGSFFGTALGYFTSFNPLYENAFLKPNEINVFAGTASSSGAGMTAELGASYNLWQFSTNKTTGIELTETTRNGSIAGTIVSEQAGAGIYKVIHDVRIALTLEGAYDFTGKYPYAAAGVFVQKAMTENTAAYIGIEEGLFEKGGVNTPRIRVGVSFNF